MSPGRCRNFSPQTRPHRSIRRTPPAGDSASPLFSSQTRDTDACFCTLFDSEDVDVDISPTSYKMRNSCVVFSSCVNCYSLVCTTFAGEGECTVHCYFRCSSTN